MELDRAFFEKWGSVAKSTTDPRLRLERELCLAKLWKRFGPGQWTGGEGFKAKLDAKLDVSKREMKKLVEDAFAKGTRELLQLAGSGRAGHLSANDKIAELDTRRAAFEPVLVTVQSGESVQAAALRAARENRETSELETSPAQPWVPADRRDRSHSTADTFADVTKADNAILKAAKTPPREVEDEISRLGLERIGNGRSLRCKRCGQSFFEKMFGKPLDEARRHAEAHRTADGMNLAPPEHMVEKFAGSNRNC